jgi:hypothetical protein
LPTQRQHEWLKTYLRMVGVSGPSQAGGAGTQSAPAGSGAAAGSEDGAAADGQGMSIGTPAASSGNGQAPATEPRQAAKQEASGEKAEQSAHIVSVPLNEKVIGVSSRPIKFAGGRLSAIFTVDFEVQGAIEATSPGQKEEGESGEKTTVSLFGAEGKSYAASIAHAWMDKNGVRVLGFDTHLTELEPKAAFEAGEEGIEISCEAEGKLACGVAVSVKVTLIGYEAKAGETKACSISIGGDYTEAQVPDFAANDQIKVKDIKLKLHLEGTVQPEWTEIAKDVAKKVAQRLAGASAFEVGVVGGLVVAALGVIPASIAQLAKGDDVESAGEVVNETTHALTDGYRLGATGGAPPSDAMAKLGYDAGTQSYNKAVAAIKEKVPDASDDVVKQWIGEWVVKNELVEKANEQFSDIVSEGVWEHYATTYADSRFYRMNAFSKIYPERRLQDPLFTKYDKK